MLHSVTKRYGHEEGLSVCFRQWRAESHCSYLHGYALSVELTFESHDLDENGWVIDFGALKEVRKELHTMYDHVTLIAHDDPRKHLLQSLGVVDLIQPRYVKNCSIESITEEIWTMVFLWLQINKHKASLSCVRVSEHPGNTVELRK